MRSTWEQRCTCFETRAFRALLSMRCTHLVHHALILRSGPKDRVSKDAPTILDPVLHPQTVS